MAKRTKTPRAAAAPSDVAPSHTIRVAGTARSIESIIPAAPPRESALAGVAAAAPPGVIAGEFRSGERSALPLVFGRLFGGGSMRIKFKFPRNTPPGIYKGTVFCGGAEHEIEAEVAPKAHADLAPSRLFFQVGAGGRGSATLLASNTGNEAFEVPAATGVGLFSEHGVEAALGAAYRDPKARGLDRWAVVADKLAEEHGGLVRVQVEEGAGPLQPNEVRKLKLALRFPDNLRAGHVYTGSLRLMNAECLFEVQVASQEIR
ncbi:MAG: hypothetical protein ACKV2U_17340 [Bryobacteraceae bacterium]